jgi:hypothetical protein
MVKRVANSAGRVAPAIFIRFAVASAMWISGRSTAVSTAGAIQCMVFVQMTSASAPAASCLETRRRVNHKGGSPVPISGLL